MRKGSLLVAVMNRGRGRGLEQLQPGGVRDISQGEHRQQCWHQCQLQWQQQRTEHGARGAGGEARHFKAGVS